MPPPASPEAAAAAAAAALAAARPRQPPASPKAAAEAAAAAALAAAALPRSPATTRPPAFSRASPGDAVASAAAAASRATAKAAAGASKLNGTASTVASKADGRGSATTPAHTEEGTHRSAAATPAASGAATAAAADEAHAAPSNTAGAVAPGSFCDELWRSIAGPGGIFSAILAHPFLTGLADGSLSETAFRYYIAQDALYLREYGRALALVAAKAPHPEWTAFFCECAKSTFEVESSFHEEFLAYFRTSVDAETSAAEQSPTSQLYTSWLLATVHDRAYYEGLAAVLPCFLVYLEVGKTLKRRGSPHPLYQQWLDKYGGEEFERIVLRVLRMTNEVAEELGAAQRKRMRQLFRQGCRLEYLFWDAAYQQQVWPI